MSPCDVIDARSGRSRPIRPSLAPVICSGGGPWRGFHLDQHPVGTFGNEDVILPRLSLLVPLVAGQPGEVTILPPQTILSTNQCEIGEFLLLTFEPWFWLCSVSELAIPRSLEVTPGFGVSEPFVRAAAMTLRQEAQTGYPGGRAYADAIAGAIAVHVAQHHCAEGAAPRNSTNGLPAVRLRKVLEFVDAHLAQDLSVRRLASVAGFSPFHFSRMFRKSVGASVHQYVLRRRVERARELLRSESSVADVAQSVGFCDQSHLSGHFKRLYGVSPMAFVRARRLR